MAVEAMLKENLSYRKAANQFEINSHECIRYKKVEEALTSEVQRLRAENDYLKKLNGLVFERVLMREKVQIVSQLRQKHKFDVLLDITGLPRTAYYYHLTAAFIISFSSKAALTIAIILSASRQNKNLALLITSNTRFYIIFSDLIKRNVTLMYYSRYLKYRLYLL